MPKPKLRAGVNYTFGFVDAVARPAPTIGGWLRHVQPVLVFPNYSVRHPASFTRGLLRQGGCVSRIGTRVPGRPGRDTRRQQWALRVSTATRRLY